MWQKTRCGVNGEQLIQRLKHLGEGGGGSLRVSPLLPITANVEQLLDCLGDETDFELRSLQIGICQTPNGSKFQESNEMSRITVM